MTTDHVHTGKPGTPPPPKGYERLAEFLPGWQPTPAEDLNVIVSGMSGRGKTTMLASMPDTWLLDLEGFANDVPAPSARIVRPPSMAALVELLTKLREDGHAGHAPCKRIAIDTYDVLHEKAAWYLGARQHKDKFFGAGDCPTGDIRDWREKGAGWAKLRDWLTRLFTDLNAAGYSWALSWHEHAQTIERRDGEIDQSIQAVLPPKSLAPIQRHAHLHLIVDRITETVKETDSHGKPRKRRRTVHIAQLGHGGVDDEGKGRYVEHLPEAIDLSRHHPWGNVAKAWETAIQAEQTKQAAAAAKRVSTRRAKKKSASRP